MTDLVTTNLGLTKPTFNMDKNNWGGLLNGDLDLIDAFAGKVPLLLASGTLSSAGPLNLSLSSAFNVYRLELANVNSAAVALQALLSIDGSTYLATGYDFIRQDISAKSSGTQTFASATGGAGTGIVLSDVLMNEANDSDRGGLFTIDIHNRLVGSNARIGLKSFGSYFNNDGTGYRAISTAGGELTGQTARAADIQIGAVSGLGFRGAYALYGLTGL